MLLLLRHGQATGNAEGLLLGRMDSPLTEYGEAQALGLRDLLPSAARISRIISSPLTRARRTAESLGLDLPIEIDERWCEVDYGTYDGEKLTDLPAEVWRAWRADPAFTPPGGESLLELGTRVREACDELFCAAGSGARADSDVIVVSHVSPIKAAVSWALGAGDDLAWRLWLATASMTVIAWGNDAPVLRRYNLERPD
ncbi:MAG: histidine phosphatase family protein [Acidimicrobiales bacterium]